MEPETLSLAELAAMWINDQLTDDEYFDLTNAIEKRSREGD